MTDRSIIDPSCETPISEGMKNSDVHCDRSGSKGLYSQKQRRRGAAGTESPGNEVKAAPRLSGEQHDGSRQTRLTERIDPVDRKRVEESGGATQSGHASTGKPPKSWNLGNWKNRGNWGIYLKRE